MTWHGGRFPRSAIGSLLSTPHGLLAVGSTGSRASPVGRRDHHPDPALYWSPDGVIWSKRRPAPVKGAIVGRRSGRHPRDRVDATRLHHRLASEIAVTKVRRLPARLGNRDTGRGSGGLRPRSQWTRRVRLIFGFGHNRWMSYDLERFLREQEHLYGGVLEELRQGRKTGHWIWFIFPQIAGLGRSDMSRHFAIVSLGEARAYLGHPVLGVRLHECTGVVLATKGTIRDADLRPARRDETPVVDDVVPSGSARRPDVRASVGPLLRRPPRRGDGRPARYYPADRILTGGKLSWSTSRGSCQGNVEATSGFEPLNRGFADLPLNHLGTSPRDGPPKGSGGVRAASLRGRCPSRIRTSVNGSKVRCPTTGRRGTGRVVGGCRPARPGVGREIGAGDGVRTRDLNLGKVMLYQLSHFRSRTGPPMWCREPGSNWRHRDFQSRALPTELSRPEGLTRLAARRRAGGYHGPRTAFNRAGLEVAGRDPAAVRGAASSSAVESTGG